MKTNPMMFKLAGLALVTMAGAGVFIACSSDDNNGPGPVIGDDSGASSSGTGSSGASSSGTGSSGASSSGASSSGASSSGASSSGASSSSSGGSCVPDGGAAATCNSCATLTNDQYNRCSSYGCAGFYNNSTHGVPATLPTL
jgi:hypothetical protein